VEEGELVDLGGVSGVSGVSGLIRVEEVHENPQPSYELRDLGLSVF